MTSPVDVLLPIITVFVSIRTQVVNWFRSRAVPRPVRDLTVGIPVEFDDLKSESNKQEVRQHDYYDRRKETLNSKERKYAVAAEDSDNVLKDPYTNEALETLFSRAVKVGKGLDSLFTRKDENHKSSSDCNVAKPVTDGEDGSADSKNDNAKGTATETDDKMMLPREAEARELYKLYEVPLKLPMNNEQTSVTSTESLDSRLRVSWRQWINHLRSRSFSFDLKNPFKRHNKSCKETNKAGTAGKAADGTGSEGTERDTIERKVQAKGHTRTKYKNLLRKMVTKRVRQEETNDATTKDDNQTNDVLVENNQEKVQTQHLITPASMYGPSAMPLPKCSWGHDDCDYIQEKMKLLGSLATRDHQQCISVEPVQRIKPRSHGTNHGPNPTHKKSKIGKRLAWFTSRSKKANQESVTRITKLPIEKRDTQVN